MSDFADRQRRTEHAADPYRGTRPYTTWTPIARTLRGSVGTLDYTTPWVDLGGTHSPGSYHVADDGKTWLRGAVTGGEVGSTILTLPLALAPEYDQRFVVATSYPDGSAGPPATIDVLTTGDVVLVAVG